MIEVNHPSDLPGAIVSPDFDDYASGRIDASVVRCALCQNAPCNCPEFGTPEYFALIDRRHGRADAIDALETVQRAADEEADQ